MNDMVKYFKLCPFCGYHDEFVQTNTRIFHGSDGDYYETDYYLHCENCELTIGKGEYDQWGDLYNDFSSYTEALNFWNRRLG